MRFFALLGGLVLLGCESGSGGELGNGQFEYGCVSSDDAWCGSTTAPAIGVGGRFKMEFVVGPKAPSWAIGSKVHSPTRLIDELDDDSFRAVAPGYAVLHARSSAGALVDYQHLRLETPTGLRVTGWCSGPSDCVMSLSIETASFAVGGGIDVQAVPLGRDVEVLAGAMEPVWRIAPEGVATVDATGARASVKGVAAGNATLTVALGELEVTVAVEVTP